MQVEGLTTTILERVKSHQFFWKWFAIILGITILMVQWVRLGIEPRGDFDLHWELGRRLAAGEFIYLLTTDLEELALDYPYPSFWALVHAPLTFMPMHVAQVVIYPLFVVALLGLLWTLNRLTEKHLPLHQNTLFWVAAFALLLTSRFLVRDMIECGVNLALVALSWLGIYMWTRRRELLGGSLLGLAIALKCTPALFLAYFAWKRQWKMVASTVIAAAAFTLSPAAISGAGNYVRGVDFWFTFAWKGVGERDPSQGVLGPEQIQNVSFRPAMARFLMHLPEDHKSRYEHPLYFDFLNLPPVVAGIVIKLMLLSMVAGLAWKSRNPVVERDDLSIYWECATVSIMILLLSPITWGQHCVGLLPVFYLFARTHSAGHALPRWMYWTVGFYGLFTLALNREVIGKDMTWLLDSYRLPTFGFLALVVLAVGCHARCRESARLLSIPQENDLRRNTGQAA